MQEKQLESTNFDRGLSSVIGLDSEHLVASELDSDLGSMMKSDQVSDLELPVIQAPKVIIGARALASENEAIIPDQLDLVTQDSSQLEMGATSSQQGDNQVTSTSVDQRKSWGIKSWNWGGFILSFQMGVGNRAYLALLTLVPFLNIAWIFVSAATIERWVRDNPENDFRDELEFRRIMDTWHRAGFWTFIVAMIAAVISAIIFITVIIASMSLFHQQFDPYTNY